MLVRHTSAPTVTDGEISSKREKEKDKEKNREKEKDKEKETKRDEKEKDKARIEEDISSITRRRQSSRSSSELPLA